MSPLRIWAMAARPRTLPAAIAPVLVGSAAANYQRDPCNLNDVCPLITAPPFQWDLFVAALIGSIFIQIGTNLANDYSDAKRGADTAERLGPVRVTSAGLVAPRRVLVATWVAFGVAVLAGLYLTAEVGPEILVVGVASILAGVLYTGGPRPYGYAGLGEVFVFVFFGLVAVNGSYYVQLEEVAWMPFVLSIAVGLLATAILVVNNLRDMETDRRADKITLAVRLGRPRTRLLYAWMLALSFLIVPISVLVADAPGWALVALGAAPLASRPLRAVMTRTDGEALNGALAGTGALLGVFSILLSAGLLIAAA